MTRQAAVQVLAIGALIGGLVIPVHAQYNSNDARQHGYEHGYRDGADQGRQDRDRGAARHVAADDYRAGARDYQPAYGDRGQYMGGYRDGYNAGYQDGYEYYERSGRYGEVYGGRAQAPPRSRSDAPPSRQTDGYGDAAFDTGYRRGIAVGQDDQRTNRRSDFRRSRDYQNGDQGYQSNYGDRNEYRQMFQDGFERGYQDGYGRFRYQSDGGGYFPNSGRTGATDTRDGGQGSRTITVAANRQWTPTGIIVHQGDQIRLRTTGEIQWTPSERARPAGSLDLKKTAGAPLPNAPAGALIGRIDAGQPFGVGDLSSLVVPASGLLYLGINDDNVGDNTGQYQVVLTW